MLLRISGAWGSTSQLDEDLFEDLSGEAGRLCAGLGAACWCSVGSGELDVSVSGVLDLFVESGSTAAV